MARVPVQPIPHANFSSSYHPLPHSPIFPSLLSSAPAPRPLPSFPPPPALGALHRSALAAPCTDARQQTRPRLCPRWSRCHTYQHGRCHRARRLGHTALRRPGRAPPQLRGVSGDGPRPRGDTPRVGCPDGLSVRPRPIRKTPGAYTTNTYTILSRCMFSFFAHMYCWFGRARH